MSTIAHAADSFAGSAGCAECHRAEHRAWSESDHGWALREPTPQNVLGDFNDSTFSHKGVASRFFKKDGHYFVETDGADGKLQQFQVRFTVGVRPLQQYLVETEKGRLQVLDIAWDANQKKWYHLYPDQDVGAGNGLHWTGTYKNWQARCAQCHQTGFEKAYDPKEQSYKSRWAELTISCESCHGPSSAHVAWAKGPKDVTPPQMLKLGAGQQAGEIAVCGPCHARREAFSAGNAPVGASFGDHYNLSLLTTDLYFADGQQDAEDYNLGSFLQSKMAAKGVTCSNCHEPHGGRLVAEGNAVCTQCHGEATRAEFPTLKRANYEGPSHTHHKPGTEAAQCVSCHMPERAYMVIDTRRDHFFRMPDPASAKAAGAPDACTGCHMDKTQEWAAARIAEWFPGSGNSWQDRQPFISFRNGDQSPEVLGNLAAFARDLDRPPIVRATALELLRDPADPDTRKGVMPLVKDNSDLVRAAAVGLPRYADQPEKIEALKPLLSDPSRNVRQAAAAELASAGAAMTGADLESLQKALAEYRDSRAANADMPESHMALAGLALSTRDWQAAESEFNQAASMDPQLEGAWVMLVRLRSALGDEQGAARYLDKGLGFEPRSIALMLERAGLESRRGDDKKAIDWYRRIVAIDDKRTDAWLGLAAAALRTRDVGVALDATAKAIALEPANADAYLLAAIAYFIRGDMASAKQNATRARQIAPSIQMPQELEKLIAP